MNDSNKNTLETPGYKFLSKPWTTDEGDGVGVYISEQIPFIRRPELEKEGVECIWLEILNPKAKGFLVGIIYKPPDSSNHLVKILNINLTNYYLMLQPKIKKLYSQETLTVIIYQIMIIVK